MDKKVRSLILVKVSIARKGLSIGKIIADQVVGKRESWLKVLKG